MLLEFSVMIVKYGFLKKLVMNMTLNKEEYIATVYRDKEHRLMSRLIDRGDNAKIFGNIKTSTLKPIPTIFQTILKWKKLCFLSMMLFKM